MKTILLSEQKYMKFGGGDPNDNQYFENANSEDYVDLIGVNPNYDIALLIDSKTEMPKEIKLVICTGWSDEDAVLNHG